MKNYAIGQRYISEAEPELGLGMIIAKEGKQFTVAFAASNSARIYGISNAPLKRIRFEVGEQVCDLDGNTFEVEQINEENNIIIYSGQGIILPETQLSHHISFNNPEEKLFNGTTDSNELYKLRIECLKNKKDYLESDIRGMIGPKVALIPHQLYVADDVANRSLPRVLLADEVGLGKTIEAGLILYRLITTGLVSKCLILVPRSLINQWFVEMLKRFNLSFSLLDHEVFNSSGVNPFHKGLVLSSIQLLNVDDNLREKVLNHNWDMVICDEAHRLKWSQEESSPEYKLVEELSLKSSGLLLLTATPEQLGSSGHFARLRLLDRNRFNSLEKFEKESEKYRSIAKLAKKIVIDEEINKTETTLLESLISKEKIPQLLATEEGKQNLLKELIDHHGTGRVYFRNTRENMDKDHKFFPKRILNTYPMQARGKNFDKSSLITKTDWLGSYLEKSNEKILLICKDRETLKVIEKSLQDFPKLKYALFHSDMSLMERDRQAAYFIEPKGAQILLCTEIGSEGRNFQFSRHLILFDLPFSADLLEQRIGRLDRIGQKHDIQIHVPYIQGSSDEVLFRFFHECLNAFETSAKGTTALMEEIGDTLEKHALNPSSEDLEDFLAENKKVYQKILEKLSKGRDFLVELHSFDRRKADELLKKVRQADHDYKLHEFMEKVFHHMGVYVEDLNDSSFFIKPDDNMFIPHFPELPHDGKTITFDRKSALTHDNFSFISWDHQMVIGIIDLILSENFGSVTVCEWTQPPKNKANSVVLECHHVLECVAPKNLNLAKFFPPISFRTVLNMSGDNVSKKISFEALNERSRQAAKQKLSYSSNIPKAEFKQLLNTAELESQKLADEEIQICIEKIKKHMDFEINRLEKLNKKNRSASKEEIQKLIDTKEAMLLATQSATLRLDSFRLIL